VGLRPRPITPTAWFAHRAPYDKLTRVTAQILFDRLAYVDRLKAGSFTEQQARAAADALVETVATKTDIASVKTDIVQLETRLEARFASIEARIAESRATIIQWVVGVAIAACTIGAAVASFIFKHMP
jgi:hypothetical protein